jgi:hypothetical protein
LGSGQCDAFVGVNDPHPFMSPRNIFQGPVLLSWEFSIPNELNDPGPRCLGRLLRAVRARRIDYDDFLCERNASKTAAHIRGFILNRHKHRQGHPRVRLLAH